MSALYPSNSQRFEKENVPPRSVSEGSEAGPASGRDSQVQQKLASRTARLNRDDHDSRGSKRSAEAAGLYWTPIAKMVRTDPLVGHGRHFGRSVHTLLSNGLARTMQLELERMSESDMSDADVAEHRQYLRLLALSPGLEERLNTGTEGDLRYVADTITKGMNSARSDDTKSLKSAILDWITPMNQVLSPPLQRNVKSDRGFYHPRTGELLCPANFDWSDPKVQRDLKSGQLAPSGDMWPRFLFRNYEYNAEDPWDGLLRSSLLVKAFKHVFTSPSSVYGSSVSVKSTKSSNARIHGMTSVTIPSLAYIATQVRFALSSGSTFSRTDRATDSEGFYELLIEVLEDPDEYVEVADLLKWWNQQVFPVYQIQHRTVHNDSVPAKIKERRQQIRDGTYRMVGRPSPEGGDASTAHSTPDAEEDI